MYYINYFTHCQYYNKINYRRPGWGKGSIGTERVLKHRNFKMYAGNIMMDNNLDVPLLYKIISR